MGTYTKLRLKNTANNFIKTANESLKKYGAKYEVFNNVEYGYFRTDEMIKEDCRFMNEDPEGLKQVPDKKRPITPDYFNSVFWMERGAFIIKISCVDSEEIKQIKIIQNWINSGDAMKFLSQKKSENLDRLKQIKERSIF